MGRKLEEASRAARRAEIARRVASGESQRQIAGALGVSRSLVQKELRAMPERPTATPATRHARLAPAKARAKSAGIVKTGEGGPFGIGAAMQTILPPPDHFSKWRRLDLDRDTWAKADPSELVSLLVNVSPEMSRAVWDYLRLLNSGHEIEAFKPGTEDRDERAQAALDEFVERLEEYHGSFKIIAGRLFMAAITRGAFFAELVLDETGRVPIDIATPDPATVRFRRKEDPERGAIWQAGQWQGGKFVDFDSPTIRYLPLDPEAGNPYGRPMLCPAIFPTVFLLGLMHDLRRVVAQQGYPRTNIILDLERLKLLYAELELEEFEEKITELIDHVSVEFGRLEPDDAFVNTDTVKVESAKGAVETSVMGGAAAVITKLEAMALRSLKTMPLLFGVSEGMSEAKANREWEVFGEYISHLQHLAETLLSRLMELALQAQGIVAKVEMRFAGIRRADEHKDELIQQLKLDNAIKAETQGYLDRDAASNYAVGEDAATDAPLDPVEAGDVPDASETKPEPGEDRQVRAGADDVWADLADSQAIVDEARMRAAMATWEDVFKGEPVETLLEAAVSNGD